MLASSNHAVAPRAAALVSWQPLACRRLHSPQHRTSPPLATRRTADLRRHGGRATGVGLWRRPDRRCSSMPSSLDEAGALRAARAADAGANGQLYKSAAAVAVKDNIRSRACRPPERPRSRPSSTGRCCRRQAARGGRHRAGRDSHALAAGVTGQPRLQTGMSACATYDHARRRRFVLERRDPRCAHGACGARNRPGGSVRIPARSTAVPRCVRPSVAIRGRASRRSRTPDTAGPMALSVADVARSTGDRGSTPIKPANLKRVRLGVVPAFCQPRCRHPCGDRRGARQAACRGRDLGGRGDAS
jgi:hypothetical protein